MNSSAKMLPTAAAPDSTSVWELGICSLFLWKSTGTATRIEEAQITCEEMFLSNSVCVLGIVMSCAERVISMTRLTFSNRTHHECKSCGVAFFQPDLRMSFYIYKGKKRLSKSRIIQ